MPVNENAQHAVGTINKVAMNGAGKIVHMWQTYDDIVHFQENNGSGWEAEYTFNPGMWVSVEYLETFVSSSGEVVAVWPDSNVLKFFKKSGSSLVLDRSLPVSVSSFSVKQMTQDHLAIAWNTANEVKFVRCDFSSCDGPITVSALELDAQGNPVTKVVKSFDANSDRFSIFWQQNSQNLGGNSVKEFAGAEESSEWPLYSLPPIHYQTL